MFSYGHDIESAWLLDEAAVVLGEAALLKKVRAQVMKVADAAAEGLQANGAIINEKNYATAHVDTNCDWWPQAEAMVGFFNAYELSKKEEYAEKTLATWEFTKQFIVDKNAGEWHWSVSATGEINEHDDKAGFWKCPYHNSRMCLELMSRIHE